MAAPKRPRPIGRLEYICQTENTNSSGRARSEYREWRERQERGEGGSMRRAAQAPGLRTIHERPSPALAPKVGCCPWPLSCP